MTTLDLTEAECHNVFFRDPSGHVWQGVAERSWMNSEVEVELFVTAEHTATVRAEDGTFATFAWKGDFAEMSCLVR